MAQVCRQEGQAAAVWGTSEELFASVSIIDISAAGERINPC